VTQFNALTGVTPANVRINFTFPETTCRVIVLPDTEDRMIVSLFIWSKHRNVTDRQTDADRSAVDNTALRTASKAAALSKWTERTE